MSYPPTSIVLAKVKGYPAWPAMVLDESLLPSHIQAKQPKSKSTSTTNTNSTTTKKIVPVRFFSDDTYIWINTNDIKPLSKEDITKYFNNSSQKRRKDNLLETAYELANEPPDMEEFIKYGSKGVPSEPEPEPEPELERETTPEDEDEVLSIPAKKKQKKKATTSKKKEPTPKKAPLPKSQSPAAKPKPKVKSKPKTESPKPIVEIDTDWGLDEVNQYDKTSGNFIYDSQVEQTKIFNTIDISPNVKAINKFNHIEKELVSNILNSEKLDHIDELLNELNGILDKLPWSTIAKSKLLRVLILSVRKRNEELLEIKPKVKKVLSRLSIDIRENTEEEMGKEETPELEEQEQEQDQQQQQGQSDERDSDDEVVEITREEAEARTIV